MDKHPGKQPVLHDRDNWLKLHVGFPVPTVAELVAISDWIDRIQRGEIFDRSHLLDHSGEQRLTLRLVRNGRRLALGFILPKVYTVEQQNGAVVLKPSLDIGSDFHSLVWERHIESEWRRYSAISAARFRRTAKHAAWVAALHKSDSENGTAIILVGDSSRGTDAYGGQSMFYSWRLWDLHANRQIAVLMRCDGPWEPYDDHAGQPPVQPNSRARGFLLASADGRGPVNLVPLAVNDPPCAHTCGESIDSERGTHDPTALLPRDRGGDAAMDMRAHWSCGPGVSVVGSQG